MCHFPHDPWQVILYLHSLHWAAKLLLWALAMGAALWFGVWCLKKVTQSWTS
jgi:hypothetical protein